MAEHDLRVDAPLAPTLPHLLGRAAQHNAERIAIAGSGDSGLTYAQWHARSAAIAAALTGSRRRPDVVGVAANDWDGYAVSLLGVLAAGCVAVPLGAHLGEIEAGRILRSAGASALVYSGGVRVADVEVLDVADLEAADGEPGDIRADPDADALVLRCDGRLTRGAPVRRTHRDLVTGPLPVESPGADPCLVHLFAPATRYAHEVLRVAIAGAPVRCVAAEGFDPVALAAHLGREAAPSCLLHAAVAEALVTSDEARAQDLAGVTSVILVHASEGLAGRVGEVFSSARVSSLASEPRAWGDDAANDDGASTAPVAPSQEGMLWHELFAPGSQNLPGLARRYRGPLDVAALERALNDVVRRHAPLRTSFEVRDGRLLQIVARHRPRPLEMHDLSGLPAADRDAAVDAEVARAGARPFDLVAGPLFAAKLFRLAAEEHVLVIRTHHAVFDDWSVGVFRSELVALYSAFVEEKPSPLPDLTASFPAFSANVSRRLTGPDGERDVTFWRDELAGAPVITQLHAVDPFAPPGAPQPSAGPITLALPAELSKRVRIVARAARATVFMTMLAAFGTLVAIETGRNDLLLATVVANRNRPELEGLIACFTKKVPLRLRLGGDPPFSDVIARTRKSLLAALSHPAPAFETVIGGSLGNAAAAHGLVPHVAIVFQGVTPRRELVLPAVETAGFETSARTTRAHFAAGRSRGEVPWGAGVYSGTFAIFSLEDDGDDIKISARGAFFAPEVERLLERYEALLGEVVDDPAARLTSPHPDGHAATRGVLDLRGARVDLEKLRSALVEGDGVEEVRLELDRDAPDGPLLTAAVAGEHGPDLGALRIHLWSRLPGYPWPAAVTRRGAPLPARPTPDEVALRALWRAAPGTDEEGVSLGRYWQNFSFVEALEEAHHAGLRVTAAAVTHNRTLDTLGVALASMRHTSHSDAR